MQGLVRAVRSCQETLKAATLIHFHGGESSKAVKIYSLLGRVNSSRSRPVQLKGLENVSVAEVLMTKGGEKTGSWLWCRSDDAVIDAVKHMAENNIGSLVVLKPGDEHPAGIITERGCSCPLCGSCLNCVQFEPHVIPATSQKGQQILGDPNSENEVSTSTQIWINNINAQAIYILKFKTKYITNLRLFPDSTLEIVLLDLIIAHGGTNEQADYTRKIIAQGRSPIYTRVGEIMTDKDKLITVTSDTNILQAMQLMTENRIRHVPVIDGRIVGMISIVDVVRAVVEQQSGELKQLNEFIRGDYY